MVVMGRVGGFFIITIITILVYYLLVFRLVLVCLCGIFFVIAFFFSNFSLCFGKIVGIDEHANIDSIGSVAELEDLAAAADCVLVSLDGFRFRESVLVAAGVHVRYVRVCVCSVIAHGLPSQSIIAVPA